MKVRSMLAMFFGVALALMAFLPAAHADQWNEMTKLKFDEPVQIPGHEVLPAGNYWFVLANSSSDRNIVNVFSSNWKHEYATLLTVPTIRMQPTKDTVVKFAERPHDQPPALLKWYYPGRQTGQEFVYSAKNERQFKRDVQENVLAEPFASR